MGIRWNKDKTKFTPSTGAGVPDKYELEVFQGDSIDLLDFVQFIDDSRFTSEDIWKRTLVNAAYYTDNGAGSPTDTFKPEYADDDEIRQYASKKTLNWSVKLKGGIPDPFGIANVLVNKYGILDSSVGGITVDMEVEVWVVFKDDAGIPTTQILPAPEDKDTDVVKKLTVKIKSNSFLGEGGLLNSVTGSIDKYVTDAMDYVSGAIAGGIGIIGEGVGWGISQASSLFGAEKPKGYNANQAKTILDEEKEREQSVFGTILGYPAGLLSFITARQNAAIIKEGLKTISLATRIYKAYTQGKTALATAAILSKIETLLDFEKLTKKQQIIVSRFLGTNPKTIKRICDIARKILKVERMVSNNDYSELEGFVLQEMDKNSIDELSPELKSLVSGEIFEDMSTGAVIKKTYNVVDKDTVTIELQNPKFSEMPGNNLILTRIEIESMPNKKGDFIPIKTITNAAELKSGSDTVKVSFDQGLTVSPTGDKCEIVYSGTVGTETGTVYRANGLFPNGKDTITVKLNNTKYDPLFEYEDGDFSRIGYIKLKIKYHYMGNTQPMIQKQEFDPVSRTYVTKNVKLEAADVLLAEGETLEDEIEYEGTVPNSYAEQQEKQSNGGVGFQTTKTAMNAYAVYQTYKKTQFLSIFDAVDFKNLPKPVQTLIVTLGGTLGISSSEIVRYYEVLSGAKNLYELSTKGFQHYNSLPPELKSKISKQLGVSESTLGEVIPLAGDLTDMVTGKRFNEPGKREEYLKGLFDKYGGQLLNSFGPNGEIWEKYNRKLPNGKWDLTKGDIDPKLRESIARAFGFTDIQELKPPFEKFNGEDITHKEVPGLAQVKCGRLIAKGLQFRESLAKGIALKNRLLEKYERVKNAENALENEELMLGIYDDVVDTKEAFDKEGVLSQIYDDAESLAQDPYADFLDSYGDEEWRSKFGVEDKYIVKDSDGNPTTGGAVRYGTYTLWTYDWVTDIKQDPLTGIVELKGTPPAGFVFDSNKINWDIEPGQIFTAAVTGQANTGGGGTTGNGSNDSSKDGEIINSQEDYLEGQGSGQPEETPPTLTNKLTVNGYGLTPDRNVTYGITVEIMIKPQNMAQKYYKISQDGFVEVDTKRYNVDDIVDDTGKTVLQYVNDYMDELAASNQIQSETFTQLSNLLTVGWKRRRYIK
jgi:hypothetical protein